MPPFHFENEILIHPYGSQFPNRFAGTMNHPILHRPSLGPAIHIMPTIKVLTVKQQLELAFGGL
jgi:hypothetical protein